MGSIQTRWAAAALVIALASCSGRRDWAMHDAIERGDAAAVRALLDKGVDPDASILPEMLGSERAVCAAAEKRQREILGLLLERGARADATAIGCVVRTCDAAMVSAIVARAGRPTLELPDGDAGSPLPWAAGTCGGDVIRALLAAGAGADAGKDPSGQGPLQAALRAGRADSVEALLDAGATLPAAEAGGPAGPASLDALLAQAARDGHGALVELLVRRGAAPHDLDADHTLLDELARAGSAQGVAALLPRYGKRARSRAMWVGAAGGKADVVEALLAAGADPSFEALKGEPALAKAVDAGSAEAGAALVRHGARGAEQLLPVAARGERRELVEALLPGARPAALAAALTVAAAREQEPNARLLLERGAGIEEPALCAAVENGWTFLVERLPRGDRRLRARDGMGYTLPMLAVLHERGPMLELLAEKGADLDAPSGAEGTTPLMASLVVKDAAPFEVLSKRPLRWDATDRKGLTALFYAASLANGPAVKLLLARGADPNRRARNGRSVLLSVLAASSREQDPSRFKPIVADLLAAGARIEFGEQRAGAFAAQLGKLGLEPAAVESSAASWRAGCAAGELAACSKLGNLHLALGRNAEAEPLLRRTCQGGDRADCHALGFVADAAGRKEEAIRLWTEGCKAKDDAACTDLGVTLLELGKSEEAQRVLEPSCARGSGWSCVALGTAEHDAGKAAAARRRFEKACPTVPEGCYLLGQLELEAQQPDRARILFESACDDGVADACQSRRELGKGEGDD